jgi:hypothetical protein
MKNNQKESEEPLIIAKKKSEKKLKENYQIQHDVYPNIMNYCF